jgi:hypothetical protein
MVKSTIIPQIQYFYFLMLVTDIRTLACKLGHTKTSTTVDSYAQFVQTAEKGSANTMEVFLQDLNPTPEQKKSRHKPAFLSNWSFFV